MGPTPSRLNSSHTRLILDASVLINLLGTRCPGAILSVLNRVFDIDEVALAEVSIDPCTGRSAETVLRELISGKLLNVVTMDSRAYDKFLEFTGAIPPDDLEDGEAATLAHASLKPDYIAVVDERKATRIASIHKPKIATLNTIDLLSCENLLRGLDKARLSDAVYFALRDARMRVPHNARQWTALVVGEARVQDCPSLGHYSRPAIVG